MQKKYIKIILPVVAILVILQSVMIVENLNKGKKEVVVTPTAPTSEETNLPTKVVVPSIMAQKPAEVMVEVRAPSQMQVGKSYPVEVYLNGIAAVKPLTLETYIGFDPVLAKVNNLNCYWLQNFLKLSSHHWS
jgi:hypothetical protein